MVVPLATIAALPVVSLMAFGVLIAIFGHISKIKGAIMLGLALLFVATAVMVLSAFSDYNGGASDPRPCPPDLPGGC
ncbi:MAG TPA: hypothetical protein VIL64_00380 [Solirubrobacteraceae bacterium]